jgi:hypothetical protein
MGAVSCEQNSLIFQRLRHSYASTGNEKGRHGLSVHASFLEVGEKITVDVGNILGKVKEVELPVRNSITQKSKALGNGK